MCRICYRFNRYTYRRWKAKSSRRSILRASSSKWLWYDSKHSTTNLMYRTAKGISPCSWCCNGAPPMCRFSLLHHFPHTSRISPHCFSPVLSLDFLIFSVFLITGKRWKRTQFWSSKLAVIVELYDKPTLMVKVCPVFRQNADICVSHECLTLFLPSIFCSSFCLSSSDDS